MGMGLLLPHTPQSFTGNTPPSVWAASPAVPGCQRLWPWQISAHWAGAMSRLCSQPLLLQLLDLSVHWGASGCLDGTGKVLAS